MSPILGSLRRAPYFAIHPFAIHPFAIHHFQILNMSSTITSLQGIEILDSRGRPTVKAQLELSSGVRAHASVPSGASTGVSEALELRDGDPKRYGGKGCRQAVANLNGPIREALLGPSFAHPFEVDQQLLALDGTPQKSRLGANALLAVSLAFARAQALEQGVPLYRYLAHMVDRPITHLPRLTINLFSGGLHAGGIIPLQDSLVIPVGASTVDASLSTTYAVYQAAAELIRTRYGMRLLTADEGGLSPDFKAAEEMFQLTVDAIEEAGYEVGADVAMALDVAASHFYRDGSYHIQGAPLSGPEMVEVLDQWTRRYPIISVEDGLAEDDWAHWPRLRQRLAGRAIVMGDDLLCTNPKLIQQAVDRDAANALLLKVNQIGTLYEAAQALRLARKHQWAVTISARSGETEDNWLADLAVGWGGDYIKVGSINQSERLAKYNRLLEIEQETRLPLAALPQVSG